MKTRILLSVIVLLVAVACKADSCKKDEYLTRLIPIYDRWTNLINDVADAEFNMPVDEQVGMIAESTNVLNEMVNLKPPQCAADAHAKMVESIYLGREWLFAEWEGDADKASTLLKRSLVALDEWEALIGEMER